MHFLISFRVFSHAFCAFVCLLVHFHALRCVSIAFWCISIACWCISMPFGVFLAFRCIFQCLSVCFLPFLMPSSGFWCVSMPFSAFWCISMPFSVSCLSVHFPVPFGVFLHAFQCSLVPFHCISSCLPMCCAYHSVFSSISKRTSCFSRHFSLNLSHSFCLLPLIYQLMFVHFSWCVLPSIEMLDKSPIFHFI